MVRYGMAALNRVFTGLGHKVQELNKCRFGAKLETAGFLKRRGL